MDINDFFRGFFGFHRPDRFDGFSNVSPWADDENSTNDQEDADTFENRGFPNLFDQMEDMLNNMMTIHTGFLDLPNLEIQNDPVNPRDMMLKPETCDCSTANHVEPVLSHDVQFDAGASGDGLAIVSNEPMKPSAFSFHRSSLRVVHSPEGIIEEHWTTKDSSGKSTTTVRKSYGDQSYQVTTKSDKSGLIEKKEDFANLDENQIKEFEKKFERQNPHRMLPPSSYKNQDDKIQQIMVLPSGNKDDLPMIAPPGDPKFTSIFKRFFGGS